MRSDNQPLLPMPRNRPEGPPIQVQLAVDRNGFVCQAGSKDAAAWDHHHPTCAPHYIATFTEVIPTTESEK